MTIKYQTLDMYFSGTSKIVSCNRVCVYLFLLLRKCQQKAYIQHLKKSLTYCFSILYERLSLCIIKAY